MFLLQCKQVRLFKCGFITTLRGTECFAFAGSCLGALFFCGDGLPTALKGKFFWSGLALSATLTNNRTTWHITKYGFTFSTLFFCERLPFRRNLHRRGRKRERGFFSRRRRTRRTASSKRVNEELYRATCDTANTRCFASTLKDSLLGVVPTLVKVLQNVGRGFLCGLFATSAQSTLDAPTNALYSLFAEIACKAAGNRPNNPPKRQSFCCPNRRTEKCRAVTFFFRSAELTSSLACLACASRNTNSPRTKETCNARPGSAST